MSGDLRRQTAAAESGERVAAAEAGRQLPLPAPGHFQAVLPARFGGRHSHGLPQEEGLAGLSIKDPAQLGLGQGQSSRFRPVPAGDLHRRG